MADRTPDEHTPDFEVVAAGRETDEDVIESRHSTWWQARRRELVGVGALLAAVGVVAYLLGAHSRGSNGEDGHGSATPIAGRSSELTPFAPSESAVVETGNQCATQIGAQLVLGLEIANRSAATVRLNEVDAVLPLAGLRAGTQTAGPCGQLGSARPVSGLVLAAGATAWLSVTFDVLVTCPKPLPVQFGLAYSQGTNLVTTTLGGFDDLGSVSYSGCDATS